MESCSQNHFKIFFKLLILFFSVLLTLQNCTVLPRACTNTAKELFLCGLFAFAICHRYDKQSKKWNH
jgi:hypothetical protein